MIACRGKCTGLMMGMPQKVAPGTNLCIRT